MISAEEFSQRRRRFAEALKAAGLKGALVVSRGGSTLDRYGDVFYLSGHYQSYCNLPDWPGVFSGRAHAAMVVSSTGEAALCPSVPELDPEAVHIDVIRHGDDFCATLASTLAEFGLDSGTVGLIGADVLPYSIATDLSARLPRLALQDCSDLLMMQRLKKTPAEQVIIRRAGQLHRAALDALLAQVRPGVSEAELAAAFSSIAIAAGAGLYYCYIASGPTTRLTTRAIPGYGTRRLLPGDMVRMDMGIVLDGYLSDFGRTVVVGEATHAQSRMLETLHQGLDAAIAAIRPGVSVAAVVDAGEVVLKQAGVLPAGSDGPGPVSSFPVHWGHGLGLGWERPWLTPSDPLVIEAGMYLAVERTLTLPGMGSVMAEQTLLVGDDHLELLSEGPKDRWS